jgi:hypothetical protein
MAAKNGLHRGAFWCPCSCSIGLPFISSYRALMGGRKVRGGLARGLLWQGQGGGPGD